MVSINPANTITLSSATGTDAQTVCLNTAINNITYTTTGAAGASATPLPTGVTGSWVSNVFTISGTPSLAGTFNYTVSLTGGCGTVTKAGSVIVNPINTITLTSAAGTDAQTKCVNTAITNITYATTGATGGSSSFLPTGVTGSWAGNVFTISGTPSVTGTYNYFVNLTGGCGTAIKAGSVVVTSGNTVALTSATGTDAQAVCNNTAIANITYATTGATGATATPLPAGVSGNWAGNVFTISGTASTAGTFNYTVSLTGGCGTATKTGSIIVNPANTINLTSSTGTDAQTKCANAAITNITYATTGATGASATPLPTGVTGVWAGNVFTISGTPATTGTFNYTVTLTGGCGTVTKTGSLIVTPGNTASLTSAAGTDAQTVCNNTAITNITYATTGATGASATPLPTGVTGVWSGNVFTISGTPSTTGTFNYTVTLTGGCGTVTKTGSIIVNPANTITLTSAAGTDAQTKCANTAITNITYATTGATGASATPLPTGVTGNWAGNVFTISGTPSTTGTFNYTVTLTGGCGTVTKTGSISVNPANTIALTSAGGTDAQTVCNNTAITNITYATSGATGASATPLPAGVTGNWAGNVFTISGTPSVAGTFNYTVTLTGGGSCGILTKTGSIVVNAVNTLTLTSATGTDAQTTCINTAITNIAYGTTGATGASATPLPTGVTGVWASNVFTISGTPSTTGTFNYTVTLTGGCGTVTKTGSIIVKPANTIALSSASGTDAQAACISTAITPVTYSTSGATGASAAPLPAGVTGTWASNVFTISGTPSAAGTFNYIVTLTGGCGNLTKTGAIIVNPLPTATISGTALAICPGTSTSLNVTAGGGTGPWTVSYKIGALGSVQTLTVPVSGSTTLTASAAGDYILTSVSNSTSCSQAVTGQTVTVTQNPDLAATVSTVCRDLLTHYQLKVVITAGTVTSASDFAVTGTAGPVTFTQSPAGTWTSNDIPETDVTSLTITNENGCKGLTTPNLKTQCSCPATGTISLSSGAKAALCSAGAASVTTTSIDVVFGGGTGPWTVTLLNNNGMIAGVPAQIKATAGTATFTGLTTAGNYTATVFAAGSNCTVSATGTVVVSQLPTPAVSLTATKAQACIGTNFTMDVSLSSGSTTPSWSYTYNNGADVVKTGITTATTTISDATAGSYTIKLVTDGNGCTTNVSPAAVITSNYDNVAATTSYICEMNGSNPTGKYQVKITVSKGDLASIIANSTPALTQGTNPNEFLTALTDENIKTNLVLNDKNLCTPLNIANLQQKCTCPALGAISLTSGSKTNLCVSGANTATSVDVSFSGGTSTYDITLYNGTTLVATKAAQTTSPVTFSGLTAAGSYTAKIKSNGAENCSVDASGSVTISILPTPSASLTANTIIGCKSTNFLLDVTLTAGSAGPGWSYTYNTGSGPDKPGALVSGSTSQISDATAGTYTITSVTDGNGCTNTTPAGSVTTSNYADVAATYSLVCQKNDPTISANNVYVIKLTVTAGDQASIVANSTIKVSAGPDNGTSYTFTQIGTSSVFVSPEINENNITDVVVNDKNNCTAKSFPALQTKCSCPVSATIALTTGSPAKICSGTSTSVSVSVTTSVPATATNYVITLTQPDLTTQTQTVTAAVAKADFVVTQSGSYSATVVSSGDVCTISTSGNVSVSFYTAPTVALSTSQTVTGLCAGTANTVQLNVAFNGGDSPFSIDLMNGTAKDQTFTATATSNVTTGAGTYTLSNGTYGNSCVLTAGITGSVTVTEKAVPTATPTITGAAALCAGTSNSPYSGAGGDPGDQYTWTATAGTGTSTAPNTNQYAYTAPTGSSVQTVVISVDLYNLCSNVSGSTTIKQSKGTPVTKNVTINPNLTPAMTTPVITGGGCAGTPVTITASANNAGANPTFTFNTKPATVVPGIYTYTPAASEDVVVLLTVDASDPVGCFTSNTAAPQTVHVTVTPTITPSVSIKASQTSVCEGTNVTFTATALDAGSSPAYAWTVGGTLQTSTGNQFSSSTLSSTDVVSVTITAAAGTCVTSITANANSSITVTPNVTPDVKISSSTGTASICSGTEVTYTAQPTNGGNAQYEWYVGSVKQNATTNTFSSNSVKDGEQVSAVLTSDVSCKTSATANSNILTMAVAETPVARIYNQADASQMEINDARALVLNSAGSTPETGVNYKWTSVDANAQQALQTATDATTKGTVYATSTVYELTVTNKSNSNCFSTATVTVNLKLLVKVPTGFSPNGDGPHDTFEIPDLAFYPKASVTIFNQWGEIVYKSGGTGSLYQPWDGKRNGTEVAESTYYYILDFNDPDMKAKTGYVTLVR